MSTPEMDKRAKPAQAKAGQPASSAAEQATVIKFDKDKLPDQFMPPLSGANQTMYEVRAENFLLSVVTHAAALALLFFLLQIVPAKIEKIMMVDSMPIVAPTMDVGKNGPSGGGGGGRRQPPPPTAAPPHISHQPHPPPPPPCY